MIQPPPLAYKKWGLQDMDTIVDHSSVGKRLFLVGYSPLMGSSLFSLIPVVEHFAYCYTKTAFISRLPHKILTTKIFLEKHKRHKRSIFFSFFIKDDNFVP